MIPKYRVWDVVKKSMSEVQAIVYAEEKIYPIYSKVIRRYIPFNEAILMQSTGLFDINGEEIFEGDVVRVTCEHPIDFPDCQGVVRMLEGRYMVCDDKTERCSELFSEIFSNEIIGNIYENKELLEKTK